MFRLEKEVETGFILRRLLLRRNTRIGACLAVLLLSIMPARPQNLVTNPGFETGDFTGWTPTGGLVLDNASFTYDGFYADFGNGPPDVTISQQITTTPGTMYDISFWLRTLERNPISNHFKATFAGQTLLDATDLPDTGWNRHLYSVQASGTQSLLEFAVSNAAQATLLDDVSVTPLAPPVAVPEPGSVTIVLGIGLTGAGLLLRRRRR